MQYVPKFAYSSATFRAEYKQVNWDTANLCIKASSYACKDFACHCILKLCSCKGRFYGHFSLSGHLVVMAEHKRQHFACQKYSTCSVLMLFQVGVELNLMKLKLNVYCIASYLKKKVAKIHNRQLPDKVKICSQLPNGQLKCAFIVCYLTL